MPTFASIRRWIFNFHPRARLARTPIWTALILIISFSSLEGVYYEQHKLLQTIGVDAFPSIADAHKVKDRAAAMVADVVQELDARPGANFSLVQDYYVQLDGLNEALSFADQHITYTNDDEHLTPSEPNGELGPISRLHRDVAVLVETVGKARVYHDRDDPASLASARFLVNDLLRNRLIPDADALAMVNQAHYDQAYDKGDGHRAALTYEGLIAIVIVGGLLLLSLASTQLYLNVIVFQRGLNPFWLGASVLAFLFYCYAALAVWQAGHEEWNAGSNAAPSVVALMDARATALQARAEESIWLLDQDPINADEHAKRYRALVDSIAKTDGVHTVEEAIAQAAAHQRVTYMTGSLAEELNNITFDGELAAAIDATRKYAAMTLIDAQMRKLEGINHDKAVALMIGNEPGQMVYAYGQYDAALGSTLKINEDEQAASIARGFGWINPLEGRIPAVAIAVELLVYLGMLFLRSRVNPARFAHRKQFVPAKI